MQSNVEASLRDAHRTIAELERQMATLRKQTELEEAHTTKETQDLHIKQPIDEIKALLEAVIQERNELLQNQERVNSQWEGRVRRLECQLQVYQKGDKPTEVKRLFHRQHCDPNCFGCRVTLKYL